MTLGRRQVLASMEGIDLYDLTPLHVRHNLLLNASYFTAQEQRDHRTAAVKRG
jgi:hypothetical protein